MRELWWRACGAWDRVVSLKVLVLSAIGGKQADDIHQLLHPLRSLEIPPPTPEEEAAASAVAFDLLGRALKASWENDHPKR